MSDDLIRRSDAIKTTWQEPTYTDPLNVLTEVRDRIKAIPAVEPKQGEWIPCSERLPTNDDWVIVSVLDETGDTPYRYSDFGWYFERAKCWIVESEQRTDVVAWMPLPKPWKGAEDE